MITELEAIAGGYEQRHKAKQNQRTGWCQKEIVLSAQLSSMPCAFPIWFIASTFRHLMRDPAVPAGDLVGLCNMQGQSGIHLRPTTAKPVAWSMRTRPPTLSSPLEGLMMNAK